MQTKRKDTSYVRCPGSTLAQRVQQLLRRDSPHSAAPVIHGCGRRDIALTLLPVSVQGKAGHNNQKHQSKRDGQCNEDDKADR